MTNKIEEIRKALEGATPGPWWSHCDDDSFCFRVRQWSEPSSRGAYENGRLICATSSNARGSYSPEKVWASASNPPFCSAYFDACLIALAPDMARIVLEQAEALKWIIDNPGAHPANMVKVAEAAYRKAVEGEE